MGGIFFLAVLAVLVAALATVYCVMYDRQSLSLLPVFCAIACLVAMWVVPASSFGSAVETREISSFSENADGSIDVGFPDGQSVHASFGEYTLYPEDPRREGEGFAVIGRDTNVFGAEFPGLPGAGCYRFFVAR